MRIKFNFFKPKAEDEKRASKYIPSKISDPDKCFIAPYQDDSKIEPKQFFNGSQDKSIKTMLALHPVKISFSARVSEDDKPKQPIFNTEKEAIDYLKTKVVKHDTLFILHMDASKEKILEAISKGTGFGQLIIKAINYTDIVLNWQDPISHPKVEVISNPCFALDSATEPPKEIRDEHSIKKQFQEIQSIPETRSNGIHAIKTL
jgi:hypothetical protein